MKAYRQSPALPHQRRRSAPLLTLLLALLLLALPSGAALRAQDGAADPTPTPEATELPPTQPPPNPNDGTVTLVEADATPAPEVTEEAPANEPEATETPPPPTAPQPVPQTSCRLEIGDAGDSNPYTYRAEAVGSPDIVGWSWNMGDSTIYSGTTVVNHTYAVPDTYTITLTCTPSSGAQLTLTGTVFVTSSPIAAFDVLPSTVNVGAAPFSVSTLNRSSGTGLSYEWRVNTSSNPLGTPVLFTSTATNIAYDLPSYGSFWFHLFVTDLGGTTVIASQQVTLQAPAPLARFNMTPTDGIAPLTVTFTGVDLGGGPIDTWEWNLDDGSPPQTFPTGAPFNYTYTAEGTFVVRLRYTGPGGSGEFAREVGVYPPSEPVDAQFSWQSQGNAGGGLVTICFTNLSTGPWINSYWDWEDDGVYDFQTTDSIVCRDFPEGACTVRLWVADNLAATPSAPSGATSNAAQNLSVIAAPVASFNAVPGTTIIWGDLINFVDTSTGTITSWSWDFNGDGVEDSSLQNPSGIALGQTIGGLGGNTVRLTVTGPGGSSYAEMLIVVARREITCAIGGPTEVIPTASAQSYTGIVNELLGRDVTYTWRVTGTDSVPPNELPLTVIGGPAASVANLPLNFADFGVGTFVIALEAQTADGAACSAVRTVTYDWRPLDCRMLVSPAFPAPHYPSTTNYDFSVDMANLNLDGRTISSIRWTVNGAAQGAFDDLQTFTRQWLSPASETIRYDIEVDNGDGTTATCYEEQPVTVQDWPALTCGAPTGNGSPQPVTPDNPTREYSYTAPVSGAAGRTVTYTWTITGGTITSPNPRVGNATATARWDAAAGAFPPAPADESIGYTARVTNPDGTTDECSASRSIAVTVNRLQCNTPTGDQFPVVGEIELYSPVLNNTYGRPISLTWAFQTRATSSDPWQDVVPPPAFDLNANPFSYQFLVPGAEYRLLYTANAAAAADLPSDSCTSAEALIRVGGSDVSFDCDAFPGAPTNNLNPVSASASYPYTIDMDNGNNLPLTYTWVLVGPGATERVLGTFDNIISNGFITFPPAPSAGFPGAAFGPVDNYTLRVDVRATNPAATPYTCSMSQPLTVGALDVNYAFVYSDGSAVNPSAVEVGRQICFTNTSSTSHGGIDAMTYNWNFGTANNTLGVSTQAGQNPSPACFSFTQPSGPGGYTVTLTGEALDLDGNPNGRTASYNITFYVYSSQSIAINRSNEQFAPTTMNFQAIGVNITSGYNWLFELWNGATWVNFPNNTKTGQTVNQFFPSEGRYRATVTGSGPLGVTTAQTEFQLLALTDIRAAFTPAPYGGMAPLNVCFTDRSASSSPIVSWEWDFESDGTVDATTQNPCTTYTAPGQTFTVTLRIRNQNGQTATATNIVRTYRDWESGASFSIAPQGAGRYCFTANITGLTLVGWDFGDGTTGGPDSPICTTYASSGTYVVTMTVRNPSTGETGDIQRGLEVDLSGGPAPNLSVTGVCSADRTATFRVTNSGGAMTTPDIVTIRDVNGSVIRTESLLLAAGAFRDFILTDMDGPVSFQTLDSGLSATATCFYRPVLSAVSDCADPLAFTVSNSGGPMLEPQPYTVTNAGGQPLASGTLQIAAGGSQTITLTGISPYGGRTLTTNGFAGALNQTQTCAAPRLTVRGACYPAVFTVSNSGGPMLASQPFTLIQGDGADLTPASSAFSLAAGESLDIPVPASADMNRGVTFSTARFEATAALNLLCPSGGSGDNTTLGGQPGQPAASAGGPRADGLGAGVFELPPALRGAAVGGPVCGVSCPVWRVYHSDDTGDWEIFRLGSPANNQTQRINLSHGPNADDMSPSRSPDSRWIAFTSNRDSAAGQPENWEIYIASTDGDPASVQRVTFNSFALDTNPAWGPNNAIVYQTTRHGSWDLYLVDMETGIEYRLTDSPWDEINPAWSPDGSRIAFQSNREGRWHIYALDLAGRSIAQLTDDGDAPVYDVDPQFSPDGSRIAFRRYDRPDGPSRLMLMDADGRGQRTITAPDMDATNQAWSPSGRLIAFQAARSGQLDVYVYDTASGQTRQLTDSAIPDYAPTWLCGDDIVVFTSDAAGSPDIYQAPALPLDAPAVDVAAEAERLTFEPANDIYPQNMPPKEFASREGQTSAGAFGLQTAFLLPNAGVTPPDLTRDDGRARAWRPINACPAPGA